MQGRGGTCEWGWIAVLGVALALVAGCAGGDADGADDEPDPVDGLSGIEGIDQLCRDAAATIAPLEFPLTTSGMRDVGRDVLYPTLNAGTASPMDRVDVPTELRSDVGDLSDAILDMVRNMDRFLDEMQRKDTVAAIVHLDEGPAVRAEIDRLATAVGSRACTGAALSGGWYEAARSLYDAETFTIDATGDYRIDAQAACDLHAAAFLTQRTVGPLLAGDAGSRDDFELVEVELGRLVTQLDAIAPTASDPSLAGSAVESLGAARANMDSAITNFARNGGYDATLILDALTFLELGATDLALLGVDCGPFSEVGYFFTPGPPEGTISVTTDAEGDVAPATAPAPTTTEAPRVGAEEVPVPIGETAAFTASFGDLEGSRWTVEVTGPAVDVTEAISEEFAVVPELADPGLGRIFVAVPLRFRLEEGNAPAGIGFSLGLELVGAEQGRRTGQGVDSICPGEAVGLLDIGAPIEPGGELTGQLCLVLAESVFREGVVVRIERTTDGPLFLATG